MASDLLNLIAGWGAVAIGLTGTGLAVRSRMSRDSTQRKKDRAESEFVGLLVKERDAARDEARTAINEKNEVAQQRARLQSKTEYQEEEIQRLYSEMQSFRRRLARRFPETTEFVDTNIIEPPRTPS